MGKFKVGDIVTPLPMEDGYLHHQLIEGSVYTVEFCGGQVVDVSGKFNGDDSGKDWGDAWFTLYASAEAKQPTNTAESLRESILSLRENRLVIKASLEESLLKEAEAVEQLKKLGFSLCESSKYNLEELIVQGVEDMTNPKNWKVGDFVKVVASRGSKHCVNGDVFEIERIRPEDDWVEVIEDSTGSENAINPRVLQFHSRPVK